MIHPDKVKKIKEDLLLTELPIAEIAKNHGISKATVNNINIGKSHKEQIIYPIRQPNNYVFSDNEVAFIRLLQKEGYSAKQIHIIMTRGSYSTISNILSRKTRAEEIEYAEDKFMERRREMFDLIVTPHTELINPFSDQIIYEDAVYIKLLGRFMADLVDTIEAFLPIIEVNMVGYSYPIETREDIEKYLEWGGSEFATIWFIKNIFNNKINKINEQPIHYDDFPIAKFKIIDPFADLTIIKEMIDFKTKENFRKNESEI
jgi:hypothetical protein